MPFQITMTGIVSGRKFNKINVWTSTITLPLTNSLLFISPMALWSSTLLMSGTVFLVVSVSCILLWISSVCFYSLCIGFCIYYNADVPEGSFIVRAHTPMSNLFSCLWFNEVDRFTSRDQLSFAYTYLKLRRTNQDIPFNLNMFKVIHLSLACFLAVRFFTRLSYLLCPWICLWSFKSCNVSVDLS